MKITRSFYRTIQLKPFEPANAGCTVEVDVLEKDQFEVSAAADKFCREEVEKTLAIIRPPLKSVQGKSKAEKKDIVKDEAENDNGAA